MNDRNVLDTSTFQIHINHTGKQQIVLNPDAIFVKNTAKSLKILAECLRQYVLYTKSIACIYNEVEVENFVKAYLKGTINGKNLERNGNDDEEIEDIYIAELQKIGKQLSGLSEKGGIMVMRTAVKMILKEEPEFKPIMERLVKCYFCTTLSTAKQIFTEDNTPIKGKGTFNVITKETCILKMRNCQQKIYNQI